VTPAAQTSWERIGARREAGAGAAVGCAEARAVRSSACGSSAVKRASKVSAAGARWNAPLFSMTRPAGVEKRRSMGRGESERERRREGERGRLGGEVMEAE
jgi:hypothetical protein